MAVHLRHHRGEWLASLKPGEVMGDGRLEWRVDGCLDRDDWLRRGECQMIRVIIHPSTTTACIKPWIKRP